MKAEVCANIIIVFNSPAPRLNNTPSCQWKFGNLVLFFILLWLPALLQAVFHVGERFWARENRRPNN